MIMFPGGFSAGDEPDGSAKFFATAFQNAKIKEAVEKLLNERDGLALGICNGFQALIKLGLVPYGKITGQTEDSPTLTYNTIGRHISKMVYTKVVTDKGLRGLWRQSWAVCIRILHPTEKDALLRTRNGLTVRWQTDGQSIPCPQQSVLLRGTAGFVYTPPSSASISHGDLSVTTLVYTILEIWRPMVL